MVKKPKSKKTQEILDKLRALGLPVDKDIIEHARTRGYNVKGIISE